MSGEHRKAFEKYAEKLESSVDTVEKVILFGSVARGEHGTNSDVDVLVRVTEPGDEKRIEELAFETTSETGISITPVIVEEGSEDSSFLETVRKEGERYVRG